MFKEIQLNQSRQVGDGVKSATLFNIVGATGGSSSGGGGSSGGSSGGGAVICRGPGPISSALSNFVYGSGTSQRGVCPRGMNVQHITSNRCGACSRW